MFIEVYASKGSSGREERILLNTNSIAEVKDLGINQIIITLTNNDYYFVKMKLDDFVRKVGAVKL